MNEAKTVKAPSRYRRRLLRPAIEVRQIHWLRLLYAMECVPTTEHVSLKDRANVLDDLRERVAEHDVHSRAFSEAVDNWVRTHNLTAEKTSREFKSWLRNEIEMTVLWWRAGKPTRSVLRKELGSVRQNEWCLWSVQFGLGGSVQVDDSPSAYAIKFETEWNPGTLSPSEAEQRLLKDFKRFLEKRIAEITASLGPSFSQGEPLKVQTWHYLAVVLNLVYEFTVPEIAEILQLEEDGEQSNAEDRIAKAITDTRRVIGIPRRRGGNRRKARS